MWVRRWLAEKGLAAKYFVFTCGYKRRIGYVGNPGDLARFESRTATLQMHGAGRSFISESAVTYSIVLSWPVKF